ncbi:MAG: hypothetical protein H7329_02535 [Opitutaceae bacterium]|nr:hypothetical protein [Cytophagales bacterium]
MNTLDQKMEAILANWKVEEYIAYLYLSIANADMSIVKIELDLIHHRLTNLLKNNFPNVTVDVATLLDHLRIASEMRSDLERIKIIEALSKKYRLSLEIKGQIVSDLLELVHVDDKMVYSEYRLMHYIEASFTV